MSIGNERELDGMKAVSDAVAYTLRQMMDYAQPGMTTKQLDDYGGQLLTAYGARSAPLLTYGFPGHACISVGKEFCHGIPSAKRVLQAGDLINIDVSAELNGFWADNGASFVLGPDVNGHNQLVKASEAILAQALAVITDGVRIADVGGVIETEARGYGYKVVRNLTGHGVGRSLHEAPSNIANYRDVFNRGRFRKNSVVAIETFITTHSTLAVTLRDGWTMVGNRGGYMAQHEHTVVVTDGLPLILTAKNGVCSALA
jgi:methionyl aminopeptidase